MEQGEGHRDAEGTRVSRWSCHRDEQVPEDVARLLSTVPEWFGIPEANQEYIDAAKVKETWSGTIRGRRTCTSRSWTVPTTVPGWAPR